MTTNFRSMKMKKRQDYNLSGVGVGVAPALNIPRISGGSAGSTKYGPPTHDFTDSGTLLSSRADHKTVMAASQLKHHLVPMVGSRGIHPIKHTQKKKNYMGIFEKKPKQ